MESLAEVVTILFFVGDFGGGTICQGVDDLYTDPQIHTASGGSRFGRGNMGLRGIALFFASHRDSDQALSAVGGTFQPSWCGLFGFRAPRRFWWLALKGNRGGSLFLL